MELYMSLLFAVLMTIPVALLLLIAIGVGQMIWKDSCDSLKCNNREDD